MLIKNNSVYQLKNNKYKLYVLAIVLLLVICFGAIAHSANAQEAPGFGTLLSDPIKYLLGNFVYIFAELLKWLADLIKYLVTLQNNFLYMDGVEAGWKIMRDFVNMFFIAILVVIAFSTIFDTKYSDKKILGSLIIIAVLINFSLPITRFVIEGLTFPSEVFLDAIGGSAIGDKLGVITRPNAEAGGQERVITPSEIRLNQTSNTALFFRMIIMIVTMGAFILIGILMTIRIPVLIILIVLSPLAWFAAILPNTKKYNEQWWTNVTRWSVFPVVLLFFIYFGIYFSNEASKFGILANIQPPDRNHIPVLFQEFVLQTIGLAFLFIGFSSAWKVGGATGVLGMNSVKKTWSGAKGLAYKYGPVGGRVAALRKAGEQKVDQFKEKGFQSKYTKWMYGGTQRQRLREEKYAARAGVGSAQQQTELSKQVNDTQIKFRSEITKQANALVESERNAGRTMSLENATKSVVFKLSQKYNRAGTPEAIAIEKEKLERGMIRDVQGLRSAMYTAGGSETVIGKQMLEKVDLNNFSEAELLAVARAQDSSGNRLDDIVGAVGARTKAHEVLMNQRKLKETGDLRTYLDLKASQGREEQVKAAEKIVEYTKNAKVVKESFEDTNKIKEIADIVAQVDRTKLEDLFKNIGEKRPDLIADYKLNHDPETISKLTSTNRGELRKNLILSNLKDAKNIAELPIEVWQEKEFADALIEKASLMKGKSKKDLENRLLSQIAQAGGSSSDVKRKILVVTGAFT